MHTHTRARERARTRVRTHRTHTQREREFTKRKRFQLKRKKKKQNGQIFLVRESEIERRREKDTGRRARERERERDRIQIIRYRDIRRKYYEIQLTYTLNIFLDNSINRQSTVYTLIITETGMQLEPNKSEDRPTKAKLCRHEVNHSGRQQGRKGDG